MKKLIIQYGDVKVYDDFTLTVKSSLAGIDVYETQWMVNTETGRLVFNGSGQYWPESWVEMPQELQEAYATYLAKLIVGAPDR